MKRLILQLILLSALCFTTGLAETEAFLPASYENSSLHYPVLCLLPETPGNPVSEQFRSVFEKAMSESVCDMIIVTPILTAEDDVFEAIDACFKETDRKYRTISTPEARFLAGTGFGGYLSYAAALRDCSRFGAIASINGWFSADDNPWFSQFGSVMEQLEHVRQSSPDSLKSIYTYLDAPVEAPEADLPGSTNALGRKMISYRLPASVHEFTLRPGIMDSVFLQESASRYLRRLTTLLLRKTFFGEIIPFVYEENEGRKVSITAEIRLINELSEFNASFLPAEAALDITDSRTGTVTEKIIPVQPDTSGVCSFSAVLTEQDLTPASDSLSVRLSLRLYGKEFLMDEKTLKLPVRNSPENGFLSLEGNWYFNYTGMEQIPMEQIQPDLFRSWSTVLPGIGNWTNGYGNISGDNVSADVHSDNFDFFITGNAYYARTFDLPDSFRTDQTVLSIGYVDDRCDVWLNGVRIGETGMSSGRSDGKSTWADYSAFPIDSSLLRRSGNVLVVRCFNDLPFGAGGWYDGPVALYTAEAFAQANRTDEDPRFFEITFPSRYAAQGSDLSETEVPCLIYLPESYTASRRHYPTVYLLHQFNSDHTSYRQDHVKEMLDSGIASGALDEMIVVIPKSHPNSWWRDQWEKMVTEELIPFIDARYRTIQDSRWRLTAGCSMGGQGAFGIALRNPDLFSGAVSFFGAFSYGGDANPNLIANRESSEYLKYYSLGFICGNQDDYGFGMSAIDLHHILLQKKVPHFFLIENGGHNSQFYTPFFTDTLSCVRQNMTDSHLITESWFKAGIEPGSTPCVSLEVSDEASVLLNHIPASGYTLNEDPPLLCTVNLLRQDDNSDSVLFSSPGIRLIPGEKTVLPLPESLVIEDPESVIIEIALFDQVLLPAGSQTE